MQNLRDKLLKAGLVTQEQAKQAEARTLKPRSPARSERPERREEPARDVRIPKLPPLPGSREHQRLMSKRQLELDRKLREIVEGAQVPIEPGSQTFYFVTRKQRLRRLELSEAQQQALSSGALAVVERPDPGQIEHALVPAETAERLLGMSEKAVRFLNRGDKRVGFLTDEELKSHQQAEVSGEAAEREEAESQREDAEQAAQIATEGS